MGRKMPRLQHVLLRKAEWYVVNKLWKIPFIKYSAIALAVGYFVYEIIGSII